jgi:hypothetical protein
MANEKKGWLLSEAQELINAMTAKCNSYGYTVALTGSVLSKGKSDNDLDLFFLPTGDRKALPIDMLMWIASKFGPGKSINTVAVNGRRAGQLAPLPPVQYDAAGYPIQPKKTFTHEMEFNLQGRRIEVYVA